MSHRRIMVSHELFEQYDVLIVDVFGVIWDGVQWIPGTLDTLERLIKRGKIVIILSNASVSAKHMLEKCSSNGLSREKHFSEFLTSGEVLNKTLREHRLRFESNPDPKKYAIFGTYNGHSFENTSYIYTDSLKKSDFVYISIPQLTNAQKSLLPNEMQQMLRISNMRSSQDTVWDSIGVEPFIPYLKEMFAERKPLLIANPDKFASVGVLDKEGGEKYVTQLVVRQGSLGQEYLKMGGEVCFIGKPYPMVYECALQLAANKLNITFNDLKDLSIAMIGDTLETDILGAKNATKEFGISIDGILTDTGISYKALIESGYNSLEARKEYYTTCGISPAHEVRTMAPDGEVLF